VDQQGVYSALWTQATNGAETLSPAQAITFFKESGFDNPTLGQIWTLADAAKKGKLSLPEFCIALKLIALKQAGGEIAIANINNAAPLPQLGAFSEKAIADCGGGGDGGGGDEMMMMAAEELSAEELEELDGPELTEAELEVRSSFWTGRFG
jgi:hypothetical protein